MRFSANKFQFYVSARFSDGVVYCLHLSGRGQLPSASDQNHCTYRRHGWLLWFQFKVYAGPIVNDEEYARMTPGNVVNGITLSGL